MAHNHEVAKAEAVLQLVRLGMTFNEAVAALNKALEEMK